MRSLKMQTVCIQGLGFVGSAMAVAVAIANRFGKPLFNVIGIDQNHSVGRKRIKMINEGSFPFDTNDQFLLSSFTTARSQGNIKATSDPSVFSDADIIVVDVNLDISYLDSEPRLDLSAFIKAINEIGLFITPGTLLLIETTVPPGTCEKIISPCIEKALNKRKLKKGSVLIAHSYERVMPGENYLKSIIKYPRVYSGLTPAAADACEEFLEKVIDTENYPLTRLSSTTSTETAKVMENTYRAANIAFIDEWTKYAEAVDIDLFEIIEAIKQRDTHSNIRYPGLGVGGYCLTKDPTFTPAASKEFFDLDLEFPFSKLTVKTNDNMPKHVIDRVLSMIDFNNDNLKVLLCGVTYRQNVADTRYSASEILAKGLIESGLEVICHDPYISYWDELNIHVLNDLPDLSEFEMVIMAVNHNFYSEIKDNDWNKAKIIMDANMVFSKEKILKLQSMGVEIKSVGRGSSRL